MAFIGVAASIARYNATVLRTDSTGKELTYYLSPFDTGDARMLRSYAEIA